MVKLGVGVLIMALVLGVAAVGALRGESVDASGLVSVPEIVAPLAAQIPQEPAPPVAPQQVIPEDSDGKPFIGVTIHGISPDAAVELGIAGGVRVVRVFEGGPSDGILLGGDIIVAVGDSDVAEVKLVQQGSLLDTRKVQGLATILPYLGPGGPGGISTRLPDIRMRLGNALGNLDHFKDRDGGRFLSESLLERIREAMKEEEEGIANE